MCFPPGEKCQILENLRIRKKSNILYYVDNVLFDTFPQGKTVSPKKRAARSADKTRKETPARLVVQIQNEFELV
ncbi:MAG: hypothetical protein CVT97_08885 [Bacteroidetes bacterium HGW-Bacteroidetes-14]|nr:MAG: hypothetical protein CVT97_08885 [Bacteroidetes bacterium HGW-Bacteroidetes-14]